MKYQANPVVVDAWKVTAVTDVPKPTIDELEAILNEGKEPRLGINVVLEDGRTELATPEMTSRMNPQPGDYWVVQADGYAYLNPKSVFERKYRPLADATGVTSAVTEVR